MRLISDFDDIAFEEDEFIADYIVEFVENKNILPQLQTFPITRHTLSQASFFQAHKNFYKILTLLNPYQIDYAEVDEWPMYDLLVPEKVDFWLNFLRDVRPDFFEDALNHMLYVNNKKRDMIEEVPEAFDDENRTYSENEMWIKYGLYEGENLFNTMRQVSNRVIEASKPNHQFHTDLINLIFKLYTKPT